MAEGNKQHGRRHGGTNHDERLGRLEAVVEGLAGEVSQIAHSLERLQNSFASYIEKVADRGGTDWKAIFAGISVLMVLFFAFLRPVETEAQIFRDHIVDQFKAEKTNAYDQGQREKSTEWHGVWLKFLEAQNDYLRDQQRTISGKVSKQEGLIEELRRQLENVDLHGSRRWVFPPVNED